MSEDRNLSVMEVARLALERGDLKVYLNGNLVPASQVLTKVEGSIVRLELREHRVRVPLIPQPPPGVIKDSGVPPSALLFLALPVLALLIYVWWRFL